MPELLLDRHDKLYDLERVHSLPVRMVAQELGYRDVGVQIGVLPSRETLERPVHRRGLFKMNYAAGEVGLGEEPAALSLPSSFREQLTHSAQRFHSHSRYSPSNT